MMGLLPEASRHAPELDALLAGLLVISLAVLVLVFGLLFLYVVRYRAANTMPRGQYTQKSWRFEIGWTSATLVLFFGLFLWGAHLYVRLYQPSADALKVLVTGKQWMWKVEHAGGQKEINALHLPVDRPIQLLMTSEDVIHDFSVPAFRIKHDVLPGRWETMWFTPTRVGTYHLFCTQFCGTDHASMIGDVVVMQPQEYEQWLASTGSSGDLVAQGARLFVQYGCSGCHGGGGTVRAPSLSGLYGSPVPLDDGTAVIADDKYLHDSILMPRAQVVASYAPIMPAYAGLLSEADVAKLVAYIQSMAAAPMAAPSNVAPAMAGRP